MGTMWHFNTDKHCIIFKSRLTSLYSHMIHSVWDKNFKSFFLGFGKTFLSSNSGQKFQHSAEQKESKGIFVLFLIIQEMNSVVNV